MMPSRCPLPPHPQISLFFGSRVTTKVAAFPNALSVRIAPEPDAMLQVSTRESDFPACRSGGYAGRRHIGIVEHGNRQIHPMAHTVLT